MAAANFAANVVVTPGGFSVGFSFTLPMTTTGIGTFCNSGLSPSCLPTASKRLMPSEPAALSWPIEVHLRSKSQAPLRPVRSIKELVRYPLA
jgi:hypothetical protein